METQEHICGLLGLIVGLLVIHLLFMIYRELKSDKRGGNCGNSVIEGDFRDAIPNAESSRVDGAMIDERLNRTLGILESLALHQSLMGNSVVIKDNPVIDVFRGKGDVNRWIKKITRVIGQVAGNEEDRIRFVLNHIHDAAAERIFNIKREWDSVEDILKELRKVYGKKVSVWELYELMTARKQGEGETVWEFLDAIMEVAELVRQSEREMSDRMVGECVARNMRVPALGIKLLNRIEERPNEKLEEWIEWIAAKESEWHSFMKGMKVVESDRTRESERMNWNIERGGKEARSDGPRENWRERGCYRCGSKEHGIAWCPQESYRQRNFTVKYQRRNDTLEERQDTGTGESGN